MGINQARSKLLRLARGRRSCDKSAAHSGLPYAPCFVDGYASLVGRGDHPLPKLTGTSVTKG